MSSVSKGNAFEGRVAQAIKKELESDRLGPSPTHSRLCEKKGYYSNDRDADIIVDISIEIWIPGADRWSMLWAFECKDYSHSVPVDDVEEFKAKLDQISGANRKGLMVVSGALQKSALAYARSNGIGVIRILPDDQVQYVLYQLPVSMLGKKVTLDSAEFYQALTQPRFVGTNRNFYSMIDGGIFGDWTEIVTRLVTTADIIENGRDAS